MKNILVVILLLSSLHTFAQQERKHVRKGNRLYTNEKYEDSEVSYRKGLEQAPNSFEAEYNLAGSLYKQEKFEDAANAYNSLTGATEDKNQLAQVYHNLGNAYLQSSKLEESIEAYKNALRNNPKDDQTRYNLAFALNKKNQQQQQQQQNQDQDQQNKDKNDKDKNEENKQNQDQQEQQNKEQEKQNQQQKDQEKQDEQQQQQQQQQMKISKEDAERILEALMNEEKETQKKVKEQKKKAQRSNIEKDW